MLLDYLLIVPDFAGIATSELVLKLWCILRSSKKLKKKKSANAYVPALAILISVFWALTLLKTL